MNKSNFLFTSGIFLATLLFNAFVLTGINPFFLGSIYASIYLFFIPGILILNLLRIEKLSFFESAIYTVGLNIAYLLIVGLTTNSLSLLGFNQPLTEINCLIIFNMYTFIVLILNLINDNNTNIQVSLPKINFVSFLFYLIPFFFPVLSILGVQLLNNNISNILIMILLSSIVLYVFLLTLFSKKLKEFSFEFPIYLVAISLLLMFSLRSQYIIGWDIYQEYKVFLLTQSHKFWSMSNYQDPYNACLSITILPTIFHYFTKIDDAYIFKVLFQFIFAFVPLTIYSLAKKYASPLISFLSVFFFMSTVDFFMEMPALIRQEIAFLFFGLLLLTIFNKNLQLFQKRILIILFGISIVLSHYSTTYILIYVLGLASILLSGYKLVYKRFYKKVTKNFSIEFVPVLVIAIFATFWLGFVTKTSTNLVYTFNGTITNISNFEEKTFNTSILDQLIFFPKPVEENTLLAQAIVDAKKEYQGYNLSFYPKSSYNDYIPSIIHTDNLPLQVSEKVNNVISSVGNYLTKLIKIIIIFGFFGVFVMFRKKLIPAEHALLTVGFATLLLIVTTIPGISLFYPIGRLDQQTLFLIGFTTILSLSWILRFIPYTIRIVLIGLFFIFYFLYTTTFISQFTGGQDPEIILNNTGRYFSEIYLHTTELQSINWLYENKNKQSPVFADIGSAEKINTYSGEIKPNIYLQVFPSLIAKNAYVYSNYANTHSGIGIVNIKVDRMEYNFPTTFLKNNKNLIYNNGDTKIYK